MGMPIGALVANLTAPGQECDGWLPDGQQRLTTIQPTSPRPARNAMAGCPTASSG
jgi:hypothetical protein